MIKMTIIETVSWPKIYVLYPGSLPTPRDPPGPRGVNGNIATVHMTVRGVLARMALRSYPRCVAAASLVGLVKRPG